MFDSNVFKKQVKDWIRSHPQGTEQELVDFCEEIIPPAQFSAHRWLIDQTVSWFRHVLAQRDVTRQPYEESEDIA